MKIKLRCHKRVGFSCKIKILGNISWGIIIKKLIIKNLVKEVERYYFYQNTQNVIFQQPSSGNANYIQYSIKNEHSNISKKIIEIANNYNNFIQKTFKNKIKDILMLKKYS